MFIKKYLLKYFRFFRFCIVGVINTALNYGIYSLSIYAGINYLIAYFVAYIIATINSYLLNNFWVFKDKEKNHFSKFTKFLVINLLILVIAEIGLYLFIDMANINKYFAGLLVIPITTTLNYFFYKIVVFK